MPHRARKAENRGTPDVDRHNADSKPLIWTKTAEKILDREHRALEKL